VAGSLSQEDIDHIREGYRLFEAGDPAFLDHFMPDATLVFPETLPKGGTYGSPVEALEFWNNIGELFEDPHPEPEEFTRRRRPGGRTRAFSRPFAGDGRVGCDSLQERPRAGASRAS
jgi:ketosteroid isomerase-like protein